jgi:putative flavoprotein involved in K+ transport
MDAMRDEHYETIVVGGGQAGLAIGYHLARQGRDFLILDAGSRIGESWRRRWDSMRLVTRARYAGLPGMPFPAHPRSYPTKDETADYLEAYAERFQLPVRLNTTVDDVSRDEDGYVVQVGASQISADFVVEATGPLRVPRVPGFARELDEGILQMHSTGYRNPTQLREGPVLVVGAGNSGAEIALDAARAGHHAWLSGVHPGAIPTWVRGRLYWHLIHNVFTSETRPGRKMKPRVLAGGAPLLTVRLKDLAKARVERVARTIDVRHGLPVIGTGRTLEPATVIWATGFEPEELPPHRRGVVEGEPGLYVLGHPFIHTLSSAFIGGVGRDAEYVAAHIADRIGERNVRSLPGRAAGAEAAAAAA